MNFSEEQLEIINAPSDEKTVVMAAAAAGKTATLTERIRVLLKRGLEPRKLVAITFTNNAAAEMRERLGADFKEGMFMGTIHSYANFLLTSKGFDTSEYREDEEFDKLFELIAENPQVLREVDYLLCDESQDLNPEQFEFITTLIQPRAMLVVGDIRQCQPAGTKVLLRNNIVKNIEDVEIGDSVVYYEPEKGRACGLGNKAHNAINKKVTNIQKSHSKHLIKITTKDGLTSSYTPNHRTFVRLQSNYDKHVVYLMCDNNYRFRIGKIPLRGKEASVAWRVKMNNEKCSKIWLLKICDSDKEARIYEDKISYKYGIPQNCWQHDKVSFTKDDLDYIYEGIDTKERAEKCLTDHKLYIEYPLLDNNIDWSRDNHFSGNGSIQIYAANIIPEYMSALCYGNNSSHSNKRYEDIIMREDINSDEYIDVYSLEVEGGTYVADGIITHNSIYGFKGAEPKMLMHLMFDDDFVVRELTQNYRNGKAIIKFSNDIISKMKSVPLTPVTAMRDVRGAIRKITPWEILSTIKTDKNWGNWAILCRTNKKVSDIMTMLKKQGIPCVTFRQAQGGLNELKEKMADNTIKVLTIHSAKGLEFDKVIVCDIYSKGEENMRLNYVAVTRARDELYLCF